MVERHQLGLSCPNDVSRIKPLLGQVASGGLALNPPAKGCTDRFDYRTSIEETLEDSLCAELVGEEQHGMAFGVLATVNGIGDFLSSIIVGVLWTSLGTAAAFGYSAVLFAAGALLVSRLKTPSPHPGPA